MTTWQERFEKLYKTLGYKDELSFEEIPPDIQLKSFIQQELDNQKKEVVEKITNIIRFKPTIYNKEHFMLPLGWTEEIIEDIINKLK